VVHKVAKITVAQANQYAAAAGFSGDNLATMVAVAQAESGLVTNQRHTNADGSVDRGILQINNKWHPEVSDAQADDPGIAFKIGWNLSKHGTDFTQWNAWKNGSYKKYLPGGTTATAGLSGGWSEAKAKSLWPWLFPFTPQPTGRISQRWNGSSEQGIDLTQTLDTPITSLTFGQVLNTFYYGGGGVVVIESTIRRYGKVAVYYQHLDLIAVKTGDTIKVGQVIGYSGGQLQGGHHPATSQFSSGPHIEVGFNCGTGFSGYKSLGPNADPYPWLLDLIQNGPPGNDVAASGNLAGIFAPLVSTISNTSAGTGPAADDYAAICLAIDETMRFDRIDFGSSWTDIPGGVVSWFGHNGFALLVRMMLVVGGLVVILAVILALIGNTLKEAAPAVVAAAALA
jgi:murein DD-endopeptidase MepM/ murein hydrolase activator NlpD